RQFIILPSGGDTYQRVFLAKAGTRLVVVGRERALDPHGQRKPSKSVVEAIDLRERVTADDLGLLTSGRSLGNLLVPDPGVVAAMHGGVIVFAYPDRVILADLDLKVIRALGGSFVPWQLSLDETGRIYMVVTANRRQALWLLTPEGERIYALELPNEVSAAVMPPVLGDHQRGDLATKGHLVPVTEA